jgi:hypothetical protein
LVIRQQLLRMLVNPEVTANMELSIGQVKLSRLMGNMAML